MSSSTRRIESFAAAVAHPAGPSEAADLERQQQPPALALTTAIRSEQVSGRRWAAPGIRLSEEGPDTGACISAQPAAAQA